MIIDADAHWAPPAEVFQSCLSHETLAFYQEINCCFFLEIEENKKNLQTKLKVDRQLLNFYGPSIGLQYQICPTTSAKLAESYNKHLQKICEIHKVYDYTSWLPLQDVAISEQMLDSPEVQSSFAIHVGEQIPWGFLNTHQTIFSSIGKQNIPIYLHFAGHNDFFSSWNSDLDRRYFDWHALYPTNPKATVGNNPTWKITLASFILSGMLEKFNLRIVLAEQGLQWIPEFCNSFRKQTGIDAYPYLKEFFWFTTEPEETNFLSIAKDIGFDRVLFATDWPHGAMDIGGANMLRDVDLINTMKLNNLLSFDEYNLFTNQNYLRLKNRQ